MDVPDFRRGAINGTQETEESGVTKPPHTVKKPAVFVLLALAVLTAGCTKKKSDATADTGTPTANTAPLDAKAQKQSAPQSGAAPPATAPGNLAAPPAAHCLPPDLG